LPISEPELIDTLSNLQNQSSEVGAQPLQVMINADQNNQYGAIMTLMATLQQAGIQKVGLLTGAPLPAPSL
jgi:biopolymer transport protein TolR